jgi:hypothetical protein
MLARFGKLLRHPALPLLALLVANAAFYASLASAIS